MGVLSWLRRGPGEALPGWDVPAALLVVERRRQDYWGLEDQCGLWLLSTPIMTNK